MIYDHQKRYLMITLKTFIHERAAELRKSPNAIDRAIRRGNFVGLRLFHHNKRVVEVVAPIGVVLLR